MRIPEYTRGKEEQWFIEMRAAKMHYHPDECAFEMCGFTDTEAALLNGIRERMYLDDIDVMELAVKYWLPEELIEFLH